jgi:excinuclease ABC subunit A
MNEIRVRGARTHNLKNIDVALPRNQLVVITGLSGSGKSSLAFDTLYAEGQRRYVESLSAYARQFLQLMEKPDVDLIEGLSPAISIEQKVTSHNPRSTVGTVTEIHDYLRLLFARAGVPHCPDHPQHRLEAQTISQMVDQILSWPEQSKITVLAPVLSAKKGEHHDLISSLRAQGFVRVRLRTENLPVVDKDLDTLEHLNKNQRHSIDVVIDRLRVRPDIAQRLAESLETALRLGEGRAIIIGEDQEGPEDQKPGSQEPSGQEHVFSTRFACPECGFSLKDLEPQLFSFNNPAGACPECDGLGMVEYFEAKRVVQFPNMSLASGAIKGWDRRNAFYFQLLQSLADHYQFDLEAPYESLPEAIKHMLLHGSGEEKIALRYPGDRGKVVVREDVFEGILPNLKRRWEETDSPAVREELGRYRSAQPCTACAGTRLKREARFVRVGSPGHDTDLPSLMHQPLRQALQTLQSLVLPGMRAAIGEKILSEISQRLGFLINVGLDYLSLDRPAATLSGGEGQRIRLASQIGAGLTGVMYVLDEPSIGLHQRDNDRLLQTLQHLRDLGNTVIVVEHDEDAILSADYVIDMGPGAGVHGGHVVACGKPEDILRNERSLTGQYLSGRRSIAVPKKRHTPDGRMLRIVGASGNNLKNVTVDIPCGLLVCITGVSGSGKSTLINDTLYTAAAKKIYGSHAEPEAFESMEGLDHFDKVINVDQSPIGRTPRSNPATYTGLFTPIRELFSQTPTARERGYDTGRFSFNVKGGRCEACQGDGLVKVEMHFLPDVYVPCDVCNGLRYNRETLDVRYRGKNIAEVLELTIEQAMEFFRAVPNVSRRLQTLLDVGLGYVKLGQSATTLSGGEAQRVKLSLELSKRDTGRTLYILDEPTTGLHFHDIDLLLKVLHTLRDAGNTLVVIEHNLDVIKTADWIIDLGPEGGDNGGTIVAAGSPETIADCNTSHTGQYLAKILRPKKSMAA